MSKALWFFGTSILVGSTLAAAALRSRAPAAAPAAPSPRAEAPAPPSGLPPDERAALLQSQLAEAQARNEELAARLADLEPLAKIQSARQAEEQDPATKPYAATKLMDDKLKERLKLTADQELAVRAAILKVLKDCSGVWADKNLAFAQKEQEVERLKAALEPQLLQILDPGQYADLSQERAARKARQRETAIAGEASGYRRFFGLEGEIAAAFDQVVRGYYESRPAERPGYKWQHDAGTIQRLLSIPGLTPETQSKMQKHFDNLNARNPAKW